MLTPHGWLEVRAAADDRDVRLAAAVLRQCYPQEAWTALDAQKFADRHHLKVLALGEDGYVIGAVLCRVFPDAVQLARVAVHPKYRRCRAAAYAVRAVAGPTAPVRRGVYEARVHETNEAGIALMRKCGFSAAGVTRGHYRDGRDAYLFRLHRTAPARHDDRVVAA